MIEKAKVKDVEAIVNLVNSFAAKGIMLGISKSYTYEHIREYIVVKHNNEVIGCGALKVHWEDIAEIRSLAVDSRHHGNGVGAKIVRYLLREAKELGIKKVFALTMQPNFFKKLGFKEISKDDLPYKIWKDCVNCPKFPGYCDEEAVIIELSNVKEE